MQFDMSKLYSPSADDRDLLDIIKTSEFLINNGKLEANDAIRLGKVLDTIQKKNFFDRAIWFWSYLGEESYNNYLLGRVTDYQNFLNADENKQIIKTLSQKTKTHLLEQLQSKLGLTFETKEKKEFLASQVEGMNLSALLSDQTKIPFIQEYLTLLSYAYEDFDKDKLIGLHIGLEGYSKILAEMKLEENPALMQLTSEDIVREAGGPEESIEKALKKIKEANIELEKRPASSISKAIIQLTAGLFSNVKSVKSIVGETQVDDLTQKKGSVNIVATFKRPNQSENFAYYKEGAGNEKAAGVMEKMMWDLAGLFGLEESFAPTASVNFQTADNKKLAGSLQTAVQGLTLRKYLEETEGGIDKKQLIKATLITLVFGMFDAHDTNMIVDTQGHIKFFDNTKSMPSSNGVILWQGELYPSYRSALLSLDDNLASFTESERDQIAKEIGDYKSKLEGVKKYFQSKLVQKRIEGLPAGWFNTEDSISALEERIDRLEAAIRNPGVQNLRDLVFACNPDYKYFAALTLFMVTLENKPAEKYFGKIGYRAIDEVIEDVAGEGVDPQKVKEWCQNPDFSFEDVLAKMLAERKIEKHKSWTVQACDNNAKKIVKEYKSIAKVDSKDLRRSSAENYALEYAIDWLVDGDFVIVHDNDPLHRVNVPEKIEESDEAFIVIVDHLASPKEINLYYMDEDDVVRKVPIDYRSKAGFLKIEGRVVTPKEILDRYS